MKKILLFILFVSTIGLSSYSQTSDLFFSEYLEGSSNNKALEIFNGTGADIDFSSQLYIVRLYANGATTPGNNFTLTGILKNNSTYVIANSSANSTILGLSSVTSTVTFYNGDDAVALFKGNSLIDVIGQIGFDPGTSWTSGGLSTAEQTLVRKSTICIGDNNPNDAFDLSVEWISFPQNYSDNLGLHSVSGCTLPTLSSASSITGFTLAGVNAQISGNMINVTVPSSTNLSSVVAMGTISPNATVNPVFASVTNFSSPVVFTVTAENMTTTGVYTVTAVNAVTLSSAKSITGFSIENQVGMTTISGTNIFVNVSFGTSLLALTASGTSSLLSTVNPAFSVPQDYFFGAFVYTVTAEDLSMEYYSVNVNELSASDEASITGFTLAGVSAAIMGNMITVTVPFGTNLSTSGAGNLSMGATVNPLFTTLRDFSMPQIYTVTAQNMTTTGVYTVTAFVAPSVAGVNRIIETFSVDPTVTGWSIYTPKSLKNWTWSSSNGNMEANGFGASGAAPMESWLITPKLNFLSEPQSLGYGINFSFADAGTLKPAQVLYSTNYSGTGPVSVAGWTVIADDYSVVTTAGFKNFTATGSGYIAFRYIASGASNGQNVRWRLDNVTINGVSVFTPTTTGTVFNVEFNAAPVVTFSGIVPIATITGLNASFATTFLGTATIAGQLLGRNIAANVALSGGAQFSIFDASGATTLRIPSALYTSVGSNLVEGNMVTVVGSVSQNAGLTQFTASQIIAVNTTVGTRPTPIDVTTITEFAEAKLIKVVALVDSSSWNAAPTGNGFNVNATVSGLPTIIRVYAAITDLFGKSFTNLFGRDEQVKSLTIVGLGGQFDSSTPFNAGYQIAPYSINDFSFTRNSSERDILSFIYLPQPEFGLNTTVVGVVSGNSISVTVPSGVTISGLVPQITISPLATVQKLSESQPGTSPYFINYRVTAQDGSTKSYQVQINTEVVLRTGNSILSLIVLPNSVLGINTTVVGEISGNSISLLLPFGATVTGLVPQVVVSEGAVLATPTGFTFLEASYFGNYSVTSEAGTTQLYQLKIDISTVTGVAEGAAVTEFVLYPNPASGIVSLKAAAETEIELYNLLGEKVLSVQVKEGLSTLPINLVSGVYTVKALSKGKAAKFTKLVVE